MEFSFKIKLFKKSCILSSTSCRVVITNPTFRNPIVKREKCNHKLVIASAMNRLRDQNKNLCGGGERAFTQKKTIHVLFNKLET